MTLVNNNTRIPILAYTKSHGEILNKSVRYPYDTELNDSVTILTLFGFV